MREGVTITHVMKDGTVYHSLDELRHHFDPENGRKLPDEVVTILRNMLAKNNGA